MKENKPYFKIYSNKNKRVKSKGARTKNVPVWFNYKIEELEDLNSLKKYLNVGGVPISMEKQKEGFLKNIKKTKPTQIKYNLEDMDEEVRRLKNSVLYVGICNRELKKMLKNEEKELEKRMDRLEKILKTSNSENDTNKIQNNEDHEKSNTHSNKNYMISNCVSDNALKKDQTNPSFNHQNHHESQNQGNQKNYLLSQLQRQLFELNSKLKATKEEYNELQKEEKNQKLQEMKENLEENKKLKKNKMIELHQLEEKFFEKKMEEEKILLLKKK